MVQHRFIMIAMATQGHMNPAVQLAKCLIRTTGADVTFLTTVFALRRMTTTSNPSTTPPGLTFAPFSDGYDDGVNPKVDDHQRIVNELKRGSTQAIVDLVHRGKSEGKPYTCVVYTMLLSWISEVATKLHLPCVLAWIQPATVFDIYYYYFNGYKDHIKNNTGADIGDLDRSFSLELPGLPLVLRKRDIPSFILGSSPETNRLVLQMFEDQIEDLGKLSKPIILVNTFDALEPEALQAISKYNMIGVGPLMPYAFLGDKESSDTSFGCDIFHKGKESSCMEWLNSRAEESVVYVSFGSVYVLSKSQMEEIAKGLLGFGRPFIWVTRQINKKKEEGKEKEKEEEGLSCKEELEELGMIVPWCSQLEILANPSLGCFVTHCGWNSTLESLAFGVPMVAFPQWSDQGTNAKLIEETWKTGVRAEPNEEGVVVGEEIKRCLDLVMGSNEIKRKAKKWKELAREAVSEGGSSRNNLKAFLEEIEELGVA